MVLLLVHAAFGAYFVMMAGGTNPNEPLCVLAADTVDELDCRTWNPFREHNYPMLIALCGACGYTGLYFTAVFLGTTTRKLCGGSESICAKCSRKRSEHQRIADANAALRAATREVRAR
jgi:hypothetical protein